MPLDPRARRLLDMLALSAPPAGIRLSTADRRQGFATLMEMAARPVAITRTMDIVVAGPGGPLALRLYDPRENTEASAPALVFFHGGGLVAGSIDTHDGICRRLANASGTIVISVDYRLAPEAKFPASLIDAAFAVDFVWREAVALGIDTGRIAVGGESAGAFLAALIGNGFQPVTAALKAQFLLCPVIDLSGKFPSRQTYGQGYLIDSATVQRDIEDCATAEMTMLPTPLADGTPGHSPPTIIVAAECDPFRDEAELYAKVLAQAGVTVDFTCHDGMVHSFYGLSGLLPQADPALKSAGQRLATMLA